MTYYEIWCNLNESHKALQFCENVSQYLGYMRAEGHIEDFRVKRRKLGFGPPSLGEFNITISVKDLAQLERAFQRAATRRPDIEGLHAAVYSMVKDVSFGLTRDFPDQFD